MVQAHPYVRMHWLSDEQPSGALPLTLSLLHEDESYLVVECSPRIPLAHTARQNAECSVLAR
eukprot:1837979-Lingulodinium_polyedra.AAC.1